MLFAIHHRKRFVLRLFEVWQAAALAGLVKIIISFMASFNLKFRLTSHYMASSFNGFAAGEGV